MSNYQCKHGTNITYKNTCVECIQDSMEFFNPVQPFTTFDGPNNALPSSCPRCRELDEHQKANLIYCLQFLRNGNERIRAIKLAKDVLHLSIPDARQFVDNLHTPIPVDVYEVPTVTCLGCRQVFTKNDERLVTGICPVCSEKIL